MLVSEAIIHFIMEVLGVHYKEVGYCEVSNEIIRFHKMYLAGRTHCSINGATRYIVIYYVFDE